MWQPVSNCKTQLTIHSRLRERPGDVFKLYEITEVESDQYHLHLLRENDKPTEELSQVLSCAQLVEYGFEIEIKE